MEDVAIQDLTPSHPAFSDDSLLAALLTMEDIAIQDLTPSFAKFCKFSRPDPKFFNFFRKAAFRCDTINGLKVNAARAVHTTSGFASVQAFICFNLI
ncbi:MAG: hypothetical protein AUJ20_01635 [Comamonadaceae bacterium CG1_02_60_18]|nr:MAG: hypothetical protein AUJ20_01635 [Comamonadaceae bacterium CG1_02_60_18]PIQ51740.1 MAG: hypothetical protein COW02_13645 [Comamonadaceae bacterium CG12_big_fil_rev_8_21_14_0_65_59_15]